MVEEAFTAVDLLARSPACASLGFPAAVLLLSSAAVAQTIYHLEHADFSCPGDRKVWVHTRSGVYHLAGERYYGSTKQGKYVCEKTAQGEGDRETQNEQ